MSERGRTAHHMQDERGELLSLCWQMTTASSFFILILLLKHFTFR
jgi:hypothetical protein